MGGRFLATVIVGTARTPFGRFNGALKDMSAVDLGAIAIAGAVERSGLDGSMVDMVLMGMVLQAGAGQIPSRQSSIKAGLPVSVPSDTINKVCISSFRAVTMADQIIRSGDAGVVVAGGMESMSNVPYALPGLRWGQRMGNGQTVDLMVHDGLTCAFHQVHMALHGSKSAKEYGISRQAQDEWALRSHHRAIAAMDSGRLRDEIVPVIIPRKKGPDLVVEEDEAPRRDVSYDKMATLPPLFDPEGTVTAGNAPGVNDGATAMVIMSEAKAMELGRPSLATIVGHAMVSAEPAQIATVPGLAAKKVLHKLGLSMKQMHRIENNEAFAAVTLTSGKVAEWDTDIVNVNGGAIAFGHPIGASGGRIIMTLIHELRRRGGGYGLACICGGAAQGEALVLKVD